MHGWINGTPNNYFKLLTGNVHLTFIVLIHMECILFTACRVWYLVLDEGCCPDEDEETCACCCGCWLRCTCVNTCACVAGCVWPCCCLCTFCMCHF